MSSKRDTNGWDSQEIAANCILTENSQIDVTSTPSMKLKIENWETRNIKSGWKDEKFFFVFFNGI